MGQTMSWIFTCLAHFQLVPNVCYPLKATKKKQYFFWTNISIGTVLFVHSFLLFLIFPRKRFPPHLARWVLLLSWPPHSPEPIGGFFNHRGAAGLPTGIGITLPKTNSIFAPKNWLFSSSESSFPGGAGRFFRGENVSFREGKRKQRKVFVCLRCYFFTNSTMVNHN